MHQCMQVLYCNLNPAVTFLMECVNDYIPVGSSGMGCVNLFTAELDLLFLCFELLDLSFNLCLSLSI